MKQNKFNDLPLDEKVLIISEYAKFLLTVEIIGYRMHLYSLNHNYVEVRHSLLSREVETISIIGYKELDKYLNRISLNYN